MGVGRGLWMAMGPWPRKRGRGGGEDSVMPCLIALLVWFASALGIGWILARAAALADRRAPQPPATRPTSAPDAHPDER